MALWNEAHRIRLLLEHLDKYFSNWVIAVQESDDNTLDICREFQSPTRIVLEDKHRGLGEASMPLILSHVKTEWVLAVAGDEWPEQGLLEELPDILREARRRGADGVTIPFRSWVDGIEFTSEQDVHLRLFKTKVGWPRTMHSRPMTSNAFDYKTKNAFRHIRTLDEMILDYLRYYEMGRGNAQWEAHNKLMMHDAAAALADKKGWDYIYSKEWWPEVNKIAFDAKG